MTTRKVSVRFDVVGGVVEFERMSESQVMMYMRDDSGQHAAVALMGSDFAALADFFAHPEVNERFDVGGEKEEAVWEGEDDLISMDDRGCLDDDEEDTCVDDPDQIPF